MGFLKRLLGLGPDQSGGPPSSPALGEPNKEQLDPSREERNDLPAGQAASLLDNDMPDEMLALLAATQKFQSQVIRPAVHRHATTLLRKRATLITRDSYGIESRDRWYQELDYFLTRVVQFKDSNNPLAHALWTAAQRHFALQGEEYDQDRIMAITTLFLRKEIERELAVYEAVVGSAQMVSDEQVSRMTGVEFEEHCAMLVRQSGWTASLTRTSGDQGIDILATRDGRTVVIQCKHYGGPIGNSAVQEAIAGKAFAGAAYAVVVTTSSFTRSAQELANAVGVALLHYSDLGGYLAGHAPHGPAVANPPTPSAGAGLEPNERDPLFTKAALACIAAGGGSTSELQRRLGIGYERAARLIDQLERVGILAPQIGTRPQDVRIWLNEIDGVAGTAGLLEPPDPAGSETNKRDPLLREAAIACVQAGQSSTSLLQRKFGIGYGHAARLIEQLENVGVLGPQVAPGRREVLISIDQVEQYIPNT